uniref:MFS domain-containing protein n=1 Tax=Macrostomum lignano TaxID=282301 RepID=A0A1I8FN73_9PLAT
MIRRSGTAATGTSGCGLDQERMPSSNSGVGVVAALLMSLSENPAGNRPRQLRGGIGVTEQLGRGDRPAAVAKRSASSRHWAGPAALWPIFVRLLPACQGLQLACLRPAWRRPRHLLLHRHDEACRLARLCASAARPVDKGDSEDKSIDEELAEIRSELDGQTGQEQRQGWLAPRCQWRPSNCGDCAAPVPAVASTSSFYYSADLFQGVGASESAAQLATIAVGAIMVVMTLVSVPLMDRAGRRTSSPGGLAGITVASALFTVAVQRRPAAEKSTAALRLAGGSIASALLVVVFFAIGPGSIPWMMMSEMFPQDSRSAANAVGVLVNWLANFTVGMLFPPCYLDGLGSALVFVAVHRPDGRVPCPPVFTAPCRSTKSRQHRSNRCVVQSPWRPGWRLSKSEIAEPLQARGRPS